MGEKKSASLVLKNVSATVDVMLHGHVEGSKFVMSHVEVCSDTVEATSNLEYEVRKVLGAGGGHKTLVAFADEDVEVTAVELPGVTVGPYARLPLSSPDGGTWLSDLRARREKERDGARAQAEFILNILKKVGITVALVRYSGSGDSGDAEYVEVDRDEEAKLLEVKIPAEDVRSVWDPDQELWVERVVAGEKTVEDLLRDYTGDVVSNYHAGYENNDGGEGTLELNTTEWTVTLHHSDYYTQADTTVTEILPAADLPKAEEDDDAPSGS